MDANQTSAGCGTRAKKRADASGCAGSLHVPHSTLRVSPLLTPHAPALLRFLAWVKRFLQIMRVAGVHVEVRHLEVFAAMVGAFVTLDVAHRDQPVQRVHELG